MPYARFPKTRKLIGALQTLSSKRCPWKLAALNKGFLPNNISETLKLPQAAQLNPTSESATRPPPAPTMLKLSTNRPGERAAAKNANAMFDLKVILHRMRGEARRHENYRNTISICNPAASNSNLGHAGLSRHIAGEGCQHG